MLQGFLAVLEAEAALAWAEAAEATDLKSVRDIDVEYDNESRISKAP